MLWINLDKRWIDVCTQREYISLPKPYSYLQTRQIWTQPLYFWNLSVGTDWDYLHLVHPLELGLGFSFFLVDERTFWSMKFVIRNCIIPCFRRFQIYLIAPCVNKGTFSNPLDWCHDPNFCQLIKNGKQSSLECLHNTIAIFFSSTRNFHFTESISNDHLWC